MTAQTVTLDIPQKLYEQIKRAADKKHRNVNDLLVEAVTAVAPVIDTNSVDLRTALAHLTYLNDAALWQAARATLSAEQRERLAWLNDKQQRDGLTHTEQEEADLLLKLYRETLIIRAQAAVLLKQRKYDVSDPTQFHPLD
jgi:hypothetical protein